jgi:hypothetical protein
MLHGKRLHVLFAQSFHVHSSPGLHSLNYIWRTLRIHIPSLEKINSIKVDSSKVDLENI